MKRSNLFSYFLIFLFFYLISDISIASLICNGCGNTITGNYHEIGGKIYCNNCNYITGIKCDNCGSDITGKYWLMGEQIYCNSCYEATVERCSVCGSMITGKYWNLENKIYCDNCFQISAPRCNMCNQIIQGEYLIGSDGKSIFCQKCYNSYNHCYNCGNPTGKNEVDLKDGRYICQACYSMAIFNESTLANTASMAKKLIKTHMGLTVIYPPVIKVVNKTELKKIEKTKYIEYIPGEGISGLYYYEKSGNIITLSEIYILSGLTPMKALQVFAHEYAHAWEAENCPDDQDKVLREGFAEWVSYKVLKAAQYDKAAENMLNISDPDPVYQGGLKEMLLLEKNYGKNKVLSYIRVSKYPLELQKKEKVNILNKKDYLIKNFTQLDKNTIRSLIMSRLLIALILITILIIMVYIRKNKLFKI